MRPLDGETHNVDAEMTAWTAGDLALLIITFNPLARSGCSISLSNNGSDAVALRYCTGGGMPGHIADDAVTIDSDHVCLVDQRRDFHGVTSGLQQISIYLPYDLIGYDPSSHPATRSYRINTPVGGMLHSTMTCAFKNISDVTESQSRGFSARLQGAIRGLLNANRSDEQTRSDFVKVRKRHADVYRQELRKPRIGRGRCLLGSGRIARHRLQGVQVCRRNPVLYHGPAARSRLSGAVALT